MNLCKLSPDELTEYIFQSHQPVQADLIMMFGTRIKKGRDVVFDLWNQNYAPLVLITGGRNKQTREIEADIISQYLIKRGMPSEVIIKESYASNTLENALFSALLLDKIGQLDRIEKILIVVKNFHARRCLMTCRKWFPVDKKFYAITYNSYDFTKDNWQEDSDGKIRVPEEYSKIQQYLKKGNIVEIDQPNDVSSRLARFRKKEE